eukprot:s2133_g5.t1
MIQLGPLQGALAAFLVPQMQTMSSPDPQYFVTNWMRRASHMNYKGWAEGQPNVSRYRTAVGPKKPGYLKG